MSEFHRVAPDTLRVEKLLDAPVDTVWRWLVDPALRKQWFAGGTSIDGEGDLVLEFDHDDLSPAPYPPEFAKYKGAKSQERVIRCEPPRLLAFTWNGGKDGTATFELAPEGKKTRLVLTHSGISGPGPAANFGGGWLSHLAALGIRVAGGEVKDFWKLYYDAKATVEDELKRGSP